MNDTITLHLMGPDDLERLTNVATGLFDLPIKPAQAEAFLGDPNHLLVLAFDGDHAVGMASGQIMFHPDKEPALFINEVGVRESHQRRGIAQRLCTQLLDHGRMRGCKGTWLATDGDNGPARALYRSLDGRETTDVVVYDWDGAMDD